MDATDKTTTAIAATTEAAPSTTVAAEAANSKEPAVEPTTTTTTTTPVEQAPKVASTAVENAPMEEDSKPAAVEKTTSATTTKTSTTEEPAAKRQRTTKESTTVKEPKKEEEEEEEIMDIAVQLGFKSGDRLEVEWQLEDENGKLINKWWGCTLLEPDGRHKEGVAIRSLQYDPCPEHGFAASSTEDIIFLAHDLLISTDEESEFRFRAEGQVEFRNEEDARAAINGILMETLNKHSDKWQKLSRDQQNTIATGIAQKKEALVKALMNHSKSAIINAEDMKEILQGIMAGKPPQVSRA